MCDMTKRIEIQADTIEQITVNLVGTEYLLTPPKASLALEFAEKADSIKDNPAEGMHVLYEWLEAGFGKSAANKIKKRLTDPKDQLDVQHISSLLQQVIEIQTKGNPTG